MCNVINVVIQTDGSAVGLISPSFESAAVSTSSEGFHLLSSTG